MPSKPTHIPWEELNKLIEGSYEQIAPRVHEAISKDAERLFGSSAPITLVGTFDGHAIVMSENMDVYRVKFETSNTKQIVPISAEITSVKPLTAAQYAVSEARNYVSAFINGSKSLAAEHFARVAAVAPSQLPPEPAAVIESFTAAVNAERAWKKVYEERSASFVTALSDGLMMELDANVLGPKFRSLYQGLISESEFASYTNLVTSDLKYIGERLDAVIATTRTAIEKSKGAIPALKTASTDPTVKMFESFGDDLLADLTGVRLALSESNEHLNKVDELGKIYDVLASELRRYEVAGRFVEKMSRRLSEAAMEEG